MIDLRSLGEALHDAFRELREVCRSLVRVLPRLRRVRGRPAHVT